MWILLTMMLSALPIFMIVGGRKMMRVRPQSKKFKMYYRTERANRNMRTQKYAHHICGRFYYSVGTKLLPCSVLLGIILLRPALTRFEPLCGVWLMVEVVLLLIAVPLTERGLERKFG